MLISPVLTSSYKKIQQALGIGECPELTCFESLSFGGLKAGTKISKIEALFPRIDVNKELSELEEIKARQEVNKAPKPTEPETKCEEKAEITIDDFDTVALRVGKVLACEKLKGSDKLLRLSVLVGERERTIVSGIAKWYTPEEMVGKSVVVVANLKPAKLRGTVSEGMILCAEDEKGNFALVSPERAVEAGAEVR